MVKLKLHTILMVDDDIVTTLAWSRSKELKELCSNILIANNGDEAIEILKSNKDIQLVITDFVMPRCDGGELISYIVNNSYGKNSRHIPIILISGDNDVKEMIHNRYKNIFDTLKEDKVCIKFIDKPVPINLIVDLVYKMVHDSEIHVLTGAIQKLELLFEDLRRSIGDKNV